MRAALRFLAPRGRIEEDDVCERNEISVDPAKLGPPDIPHAGRYACPSRRFPSMRIADLPGPSQRITYARSTSNATLQHEDPEAVIAPSKKLRKEDRTIASRAQGDYEDLERERLDEEEGRGKRERAENGDAEEQPDETGDEPDKKKRKVDNAQDDADGDEEEMEMDDE